MLALLLALVPLAATEPPAVAFAFVLSDFSGPVRAGEARVVVDPAHREVYVAQARDVHVFNEFGMKIHGFHTGEELGPIVDLAVLADGSLLVLAYDPHAPADAPQPLLSHRDFRGRALATLPLSGLAFRPNRLFLQGDRLLLLSTHQLLAATATLAGEILGTLDLGEALGIPEEERGDVEISGCGMDGKGNLALTSAVLFRAFVLSPEGKVLSTWGKSGSSAGAFANIGGIDLDEAGRAYVVDRVRKVVLVFDSDARRTFLREFGGDPREMGKLTMPSGIALDGSGRAYVTQVGQGGVSVFQVQAPPDQKSPE